MKIDPKEQARQLCLNFDSVSVTSKNVTWAARPMGLTLVYSSGSAQSRSVDTSQREAVEREIIISQTISFAKKLSW
ncbi:hypothetical protein [Collimonas sp. PA-H2]|uniref:hypothetical protein n=1 Tax=Collimonas sp. PA-H2 TaxID=1881062 RepID=UPI0011813BA0|nr:hypothetical protein [Collimonas sp. PA-H2]